MGIRLPKLKMINVNTSGIVALAGLNRNLRRKENEFASMRNMTSEYLPVAAVRDRRRYIRTLEAPNGLFAHDRLCWVDGSDFFYNGECAGQVADSQKTFVRMGAQVIVFPDKLLYNSETGAFEALEASYTSAGSVACTLCRADGTSYGEYTVGDVAPENPTSGQFWMDTSGEAAALRQYDLSTGMWTSIPTVYTMIACAGIGEAFQRYDGVTISGMVNNALNGEFYIVSRTDDQIVVTALIQQAISQAATVTVERKTPDMDFLCECNNRLWGCAADGHEIYACALGDPKNWRQYIGQSTDSYAANVGSPGAFTGVAAHLGSVYFFKAECVHQLMGTKPDNFTMSVMQTRGVGASNSRSLIRANERLYFKSDEDVYAFGSSLPVPISESLPRLGGHAVGGAVGNRCFWCVDAEDGSREIVCYDARADCWVREDEADVQNFAALDGKLYMLKTNGEIWCMTAGANDCDGANAADEPAVEWMLETNDFGMDAAYNKYISGIQLHGDVDLGATLRVQIRYDMRGSYEEVYRSAPLTRQSLTIPLTPKRCHSLRLRLCGTGGMRLYSIVMRTEAGSDVYAAT